jgi:hypothetical protein
MIFSDVPDMQKMTLIIGILVGLFFATSGSLMVLSPDSFLRFYDWCTPGDYVSKRAEWRKNIREPQFRLVGVLVACFGAFVFIGLVRMALR